MAEAFTIARPYAEAAFKIAQETGDLAGWGDALARIAQVAGNEVAGQFMSNPAVTPEQVTSLIADGAGGLGDSQTRFVKTLAENDRLAVMTEINDMFVTLRHADEGMLDVVVTSAFEMTDAQRDEVAKTLEAKYGKKVDIQVIVDPELIGGVSIRVGDEVMDASVRGKLQKMASALKV
ncbi:MAG: F0F1 ATP synthase subunit delta [Burkholderiaceae bacterium]